METITWNISIKNILEDNRELFCKQNWLQTRDHCYQVVNQILQCNTKAMGFTSYKCEDCWDIKHVCFTCKSRFCNCCSKAQSDKRLTRLMTRWPPALKVLPSRIYDSWRITWFFQKTSYCSQITTTNSSTKRSIFLSNKAQSKRMNRSSNSHILSERKSKSSRTSYNNSLRHEKTGQIQSHIIHSL